MVRIMSNVFEVAREFSRSPYCPDFAIVVAFADSYGKSESRSGLTPRRLKLRDDIRTPCGNLVAFENYYDGSMCRETIVPGFYLKELPPNRAALRRIEVEPVSDEKKPVVSHALKEEGYEGNVIFW